MDNLPPNLISILLMIVGCFGLIIFRDIASQLKELNNTVKELNLKLAVVISRQENHEERLNRLEKK